MKMSFRIKVGETETLAALHFVGGEELKRYHRNLGQFAGAPSSGVQDAVEFTRLAAKRWRYYSRSGQAAESVAAIRRLIAMEPASEIAFILVATIAGKRGAIPVGLAYCRRTWCHHLALDFLTQHPAGLMSDSNVKGVGSGIIHNLVRLADELSIQRIWGEATATSAGFYNKLLGTRGIKDLFVIDRRMMHAIRAEQERRATHVLKRTRKGM